MKPHILQATAWYPPHNSGGTETYLTSLNTALAELEIGCDVLLPLANGNQNYEFQGIQVSTFAAGTAVGRKQFLNLLARARNSHKHLVYHQHAWTPDCGLWHLTAAKELGLPTIVTLHLPSALCLRGTMMLNGRDPCDGVIDSVRCGSCYGQLRGAPDWLAYRLSRLPRQIGQLANRLPGRVATALALGALAEEKSTRLHAMFTNADCIIAVCQWLYDALVANGAPELKMRLLRQGVSNTAVAANQSAALTTAQGETAKAPLKLVYLGRWHPVKGIDTIIDTICAIPDDIAVQLTIIAVANDPEGEAFRDRCMSRIAGNPRIIVQPAITPSELMPMLKRHDAITVPSRCLETGPLVVLEALTAGLFVLGSRLGGIAELLQVPERGRLIAVDDIREWREAITELAQQKATGGIRRLQSYNPRTMTDVAVEMQEVYVDTILSGGCAA